VSDYVTFDACVQPMPWGDKVYTIIALPPEVLNTLGPTKRVEGEINDHPVNLAISKAPADVIDTPFLWAGKSLLTRVGVELGDRFEARLRPAPDDVVEVPIDVMNALRSGGAIEVWEALSPGKKRAHLYQIDTAKRAETRAKRITKLINEITR